MDAIDRARHAFRLISETGIPCSDLNFLREHEVASRLVNAIEADPEVMTRGGDPVNAVATMTSSEKAGLRKRVGVATDFAHVGCGYFASRQRTGS